MLSSIQNPAPVFETGAISQFAVRKTALSLRKPLRFLLTGCQLLTLDAAGFMAAYALMSTIWPADTAEGQGLLMSVLAAAYVPIACYGGSYAPALAANAVKSAQRAWLALVVIAVAVATLPLLSGHAASPAITTLMRGIACSALMIGSARLCLGRLISSSWWQSRSHSRTIILLDDRSPPLPDSGLRIVDVREQGLRADINDPAALARLGMLTADAERVVIACPIERRGAWITALRGANVPVEILAEEIDHLAPHGTGELVGCSTLKVAFEPLALEQRIAKRLFDVTLAVIGLVLLLPVLVTAAIAIKLDSPGPILFRQPRVGRGNRLFEMYKFRSMRVEVQDLHASQLTKGRNDDRITRVGRFIRATSIDELPQIINVLRGEMSIVGPRPHALGARAGDKLYWEVDPTYWHRHAVKPGLTGLAQVRGFRGTTFADADLANRLSADLEYLHRWSLTADIGIVCRTAMALTGKSVF